jgi:hypothetical protein
MDFEEKYVHDLGEDIEDIEPDFKGNYPENKRGRFVKNYLYGKYSEIEIDLYTNGVVLINTVTGVLEWYDKNNNHKAFEKARKLKERYNHLNEMMGD